MGEWTRRVCGIRRCHSAVDTLRQVASQSIVVVNPAVTTVFLRFSDSSTTYIQFVDTVFNNISEALVTSDIDGTQVAYCADGEIYLSPLAMFAHVSCDITLRSEATPCQLERVRRYVERGFGLLITQAIQPNVMDIRTGSGRKEGTAIRPSALGG